MRRLPIIVLLLALALAACSLGSSADDTDDAEVTITPAPSNTSQPSPSPLPISTQTDEDDDSDNNNDNDDASNPPVSCTPRTDWTTAYTVSAGDTLSRIAQRTGTTADALAQGNCLADANSIFSGQQLRVPRAPTVPSNTPVSTPTNPPPVIDPVAVGGVAPSESISGDAGNILLLRDSLVTVRWVEPPTNITRAEFFVFPTGWTFDHAGAGTIEIGEDNNGADGWSSGWRVPSDLRGELVSFGYDASGKLVAYGFPLNVSSASAPPEACAITPREGEVISYYADFNNPTQPAGQIFAGQTYYVMGRSLNGYYAIVPNADQDPSGGIGSLRWIPPNTAVVENEYC